jgi:hypothetical protein
MKTKIIIPPQIVGNAGLFYVCHKLSALGWNAMPTSRNARGIDVMCFSVDGKRKLLIQVKLLSKRIPVPLGKSRDKMMGDFWIVVTKATCDQPTCYVLTPDQVKNAAHRGEKAGKVSYWLQPKDYAVEDFCERWNLIGVGSERG